MYEMYQITYFIPFMNKQIFDYFFEKLDVIVFLLVFVKWATEFNC